jgi:hypothetical protein
VATCLVTKAGGEGVVTEDTKARSVPDDGDFSFFQDGKDGVGKDREKSLSF